MPELAEGSVSPDLPAFSWRSMPDRPQSPRDRQARCSARSSRGLCSHSSRDLKGFSQVPAYP